MSKYRIVACDLDGTLLKRDMTVSEENLSAIKKLNDGGVFFVPSTGRTISEIPRELTENDAVRYVIYSNGSAIADLCTGEKILMCITNEQANRIYDLLLRYDVDITVRSDGRAYVDKSSQTDEKRRYYHVCTPHLRLMDESAVFADNFLSLIRSFSHVESMAIFFHDESERKKFEEELKGIDGISFAEGFDYNVEIFSSEAGKGNCLRVLADKLGIDICDTIAVGDSMNDASIIEVAGLGLAMENATEELKQIADEVICDNEHHAIDYILTHYIV